MTAGLCLHCGAAVPPGFSTCSPECTVSDRNGEPRPGEQDRVFDTIPEGVEAVTAEEVGRRLGVSNQTILNWKHKGRIPFYQLGDRKVRFNYEAVCKALGRDPVTLHDVPTGFTVPAEVRIQPQPGFLHAALPPGRLEYRPPAVPWIDRALAAAKEAFRDVVLEVADEAKARGDHLARAEALDDYVFFEEGLKLVYQRREERHA